MASEIEWARASVGSPAGIPDPLAKRYCQGLPSRARSWQHSEMAYPTLLIIDDELQIRRAVRHAVERDVVTVVEAETGRTGISFPRNVTGNSVYSAKPRSRVAPVR